MPQAIASRFAHFMRRETPASAEAVAATAAAAVAKKAEEDETAKKAQKEKDEGETDDGEEVGAKKADESDEDYEARKAKSKKAKAKKAEDKKKEEEAAAKKAEKDEEDDEKEMRGNSPAAEARSRERARCAAIFADPAAAQNPMLAATLAFETRNTRAEAIALLRAGASAAPTEPTEPARLTVAQRRAAEAAQIIVQPEDDAPAGHDMTTAEGRAASAIAAAARARGETPKK